MLVVGTAGNDVPLTGTDDADEMFGDTTGTLTRRGGDDRILGLAGDDVIAGDALDIAARVRGGNDVIVGGEGVDTLYGDARGTLYGIGGNDLLLPDPGEPFRVSSVFGDAQTIAAGGRGGADVIVQVDGGAELFGDAVTIAAGGRGGNDRIYGGAANLAGESDDNLTDVVCGHDLLDVSGATGGATLWGETLDNDLTGTTVGGNDTLIGSAFADEMYGEGADLRDTARGGNDRFFGNRGEDVIYGEAFDLNDLTVGGRDLIRGGDDDDEIYGDAFRIFDVARGGKDTIHGDRGNDELTGDASAIAAGARGGDDLIFGGDGDDDIFGDANDTLEGTGGNDVIHQNAGTGILAGDALKIAAGGRGGNDRLYGESILIGDSVDRMVDATGGDDLLDTGGALDGSTLCGDTFVSLEGSSQGGRDSLLGWRFADFLQGDADEFLADAARGGNDRLSGNDGDDFLYGDCRVGMTGTAVGGNDRLRGDRGNDTLLGDAAELSGAARGGDDRLEGGSGDDELWGDGTLLEGATGGKDRFEFEDRFGNDRVYDFRQTDGDRIVFDDLQPAQVTITTDGVDTTLTARGVDTVTLVGFTGSLVLGIDILFD